MAMAARTTESLIDRMPPVRGRMRANSPLSAVTWFRVGGPAEVLFRPADLDDLRDFLAAKPSNVPVTVIGVASNLLVRDGGIPGVTIRLGREFARIETEGVRLKAGAGAFDLSVAKAARDAGISGLEFLCGVPGTIGGAVRMNAGAYGRETKDILVEAEFIDGNGQLHKLPARDLGHGYRHSGFREDWICVSALMQGERGDRERIATRMAEIQGQRGESQPIRSRTGGSTFKNPPDAKAWQLIERAGCRGLVIGDAMVSEMHCNFLINLGNATAADLERLGEEVRARVKRECGVSLEWEIKRIGVPEAGTELEEVK